MTIFKNPYINALFAELYIVLVVFTIQGVSRPNTADTIFDGMAALSLFVLSAAVMGYLFLGEPLQLYINGEKTHAVSFFMKTVVTFAVLTILAFVTMKLVR